MTFTVHPDALFDPGAPILGSTQLEARDNLPAALAGEDDAPRVSIKALERLVAGDVTRWEDLAGAAASSVSRTFDIAQTGAIRCTIETISGAGAITSLRVERLRQETTTSLASTSGTSLTVDVSVEPGDRIIFSGTVSSGSRGWRFRINTDGENLWPGTYGTIVS